MNKCTVEFLSSPAYADYFACMLSGEDEEICDGIISPVIEQCIRDSGICGEASAEECDAHFENECDFDEKESSIAPKKLGKKLLKR
jgi:hypothetical protein